MHLGDRERGKSTLRSLADEDAFDPAAALELAKELQKDKEWSELIDVARRLINDGWGRPSTGDVNEAGRIARLYYHTRIRLGEFEEVAEEVASWPEQGALRATYGSIYSNALQEQARYALDDRDTSTADESLVRAIEAIDRLIRMEGYGLGQSIEVVRLVRSSARVAQTGSGRLRTPLAAAPFIDDHLYNACEILRDYDAGDEMVREWVGAVTEAVQGRGTVLETEPWLRYLSPDDAGIGADRQRRPIVTNVYHRPPSRHGDLHRTFLFTEDVEGNQYFVHRDVTDASSDEWEAIKVGDRIDVAAAVAPADGEDRALKATQASYHPPA